MTSDLWGDQAVSRQTSDGRWELSLPWDKPPLSMNDRRHWRAKHQWTHTLRGTACLLARSTGIPHLDACSVTLVYHPRDRRRRDEDNLFATLKPLADGLVDAGVVTDDTPDLMSKTCRIGDVRKLPRLLLVVERREAPQ